MSDGSKRTLPSSTFHLLAGLASGFTSSILLQPADLLKTRVQQTRSSSLVETIKQIVSTPNPVKQLWRGTLPSVIRTSVGSALYFTSLNALRSNLARTALASSSLSGTPASTVPSALERHVSSTKASSSTLPKLSPTLNLISGAVARASVGFVMMPITVIKVRYESDLYNAAYRSIAGAGRAIYAAEGFRGFFAGFGATAMRDAPYAGLYVLFYEWGKGALSEGVTTVAPDAALGGSRTNETDAVGRPPMKATTSASINFASGALAAAAATAMTNPPDAIKTRLQLMPHKYRNTAQALSLMLKEEGFRSLFDGLGLRIARKALSSALAWTVYEEVVRRAARTFEG